MTDIGNMLRLNDFSEVAAARARAKGFDAPSWDNMLGCLMLVVAEVAEAAEANRADDRQHFEEEIADTFIRLCDITGEMGIDIEKVILDKMAYNLTRPYKHGKRR